MSANAKTVYLKAGLWDVDGAKFGCHTWGSSDKSGFMTRVAGDVFSFETNDANTDVIFTRVASNATGIWDKEWGRVQTKFEDGKDMFSMTEYSKGTWGVSDDVLYTFTKNSTLYIDFRAIAGGANYPKAASVGIDYSANAGGTVIPVTFTADVTWAKGVEFMKTAKGGWASIPFEVPTAGQNCAQVAADGKSYTWTTYSENCQVTVSAENGTVEGAGTYKRGTSVRLTAAPNDGYEFVNWTEGGKEVSIANPYEFTINDDINLVANFKEAAAKTYTVTTNATNGTVEGAATVVEGESVTLTATPNAGYQFKNWTVAGAEVSTANPYTFTVNEDVTVTANFEELPKETVYFVNNEGWDEVNAYAWNKPSGVNNGWPGVAATKTEEKVAGFDVYSFTAIEGQYTNVIFNGDGSQTVDLVWNADKYYYVGAAADYAGGTKDEVAAALAALVTYDYYVVGTVNNWILKDAAFGMTDENADGVYEKEVTLTSGKNQLKVNNGTWEDGNIFGYDQLVATYEGVEKGSDSDYNNIIITLAAEKTITVKFDKNKKTITLEGLTELVKETLTYTVTVPAGTKECYLVGLGDWNTFRPMTLAGKDKFTLTVENVYKKDEYKYTASKDWSHVEVLDQNDTDHGNRTWEENDEVVKWKGIKLLSYFEVSVNLNNPEWGAVAGNAGEYLEGEQATLTATAAEGYEFTCWTSGEDTVSTENPYKFTVTADIDLVANFKEAATEIVLENAYKEVYTIMNRANFFGEHATYGDISVQVNNYNGYGTYAEGVSSRIDGVKVNGSATFENKGETDLLTATLTDEEGTVYIVKAEVAAPKTYNVVATEAQYTKAETWDVTYTVTGLSVDKENYTLTIYAMEEGNEASMGEEGAIQGLVELSEVEGVLTVTGTLKDAAENKYVLNFTATPKASETYTLTFEDMVIEPGQWDDNLHITAENAEYAIEFQLFGGKNKGYGEYGFTDGYPDVDEVYINFEYAQLKEGTVAKYYKNEETGLATIEATFLLGIDTYIVTLTGEPLVNPEEIVPTDTINITMTEGTIGLVYGMVKVAASSEEAELSILLVGEDPYNATTNEFAASSYLVTTAGSLTFLRGGLEIVEVGDVKIAYIGVLCSDHKWYNIVLTTGTEAPTALDNLNTTVAPVKMIENGQLIIVKDGVQYNAQGAILK